MPLNTLKLLHFSTYKNYFNGYQIAENTGEFSDFDFSKEKNFVNGAITLIGY